MKSNPTPDDHIFVPENRCSECGRHHDQMPYDIFKGYPVCFNECVRENEPYCLNWIPEQK